MQFGWWHCLCLPFWMRTQKRVFAIVDQSTSCLWPWKRRTAYCFKHIMQSSCIDLLLRSLLGPNVLSMQASHQLKLICAQSSKNALLRLIFNYYFSCWASSFVFLVAQDKGNAHFGSPQTHWQPLKMGHDSKQRALTSLYATDLAVDLIKWAKWGRAT